jgi:predicted lipid-binding transport protein (Tim44 family)
VALADRLHEQLRGGVRLAAATCLAFALRCADGWAVAGGGTSSFGGGGGGYSGGGGGSFGGGYSSGGGGSGEPISLGGAIGLAVGMMALFAAFWLIAVWMRRTDPAAAVGDTRRRMRLDRLRRSRQMRARAIAGAVAEAAAEDPAFDPDAIRSKAATLFREVQAAWDARDRARLAALVAPDLLVEWERRLDDFEAKGWHNRVQVVTAPQVDVVQIVNAGADAEDRVVVHVSALMRDFVVATRGRRIPRRDSRKEEVDLDEYWTLGEHGGGWRLESIEQPGEGDHHLTATPIAAPWEDEARLRDEVVAARAAETAAPAGVSPAELADLDFAGPARAAALDLALADGRFDPDLIEASVRRAVAAWAEAVDGPDDALRAAATPAAVDALLHPGDSSRELRLVVRGPQIGAIRILALDAAAAPPAVTVEIDARGRRYVERRDSLAVVSGHRDTETSFGERWTLELSGDGPWPWRIGAVAAPAAA